MGNQSLMFYIGQVVACLIFVLPISFIAGLVSDNGLKGSLYGFRKIPEVSIALGVLFLMFGSDKYPALLLSLFIVIPFLWVLVAWLIANSSLNGKVEGKSNEMTKSLDNFQNVVNAIGVIVLILVVGLIFLMLIGVIK